MFRTYRCRGRLPVRFRPRARRGQHRADPVSRRSSLLFAHLGPIADVDGACELALEALEARLQLLSSVRMNAMGLIRYWQKRREREAEAQPS